MDKKRAIELLKQKSNEAAYIGSLSYENNEYLPWRRNIEDILEAAFGIDSSEYNRVLNVQIRTKGEPELNQRIYVRTVHQIQQEVDSIIQKYEMLGMENQTPNFNDSPVGIYDALKFHPKIVNASKALFSNGHYAQAIFEAFKAVENFVRDRAKSDLYGKNLMATVFNENSPIIQVPEGEYFDKDVQEGFKFLFMGASQGIRNPKAHREIIQNDPYITLEYLGFASFLIKRIDYWQAGK